MVFAGDGDGLVHHSCEYLKMLEASSNQQKILKLKELLRDNSSPLKQPPRETQTLPRSQQRKVAPLIPLEQRFLQLEEKFSNRFEEEWRLYERVAGEVETLQEEARSTRKEIQRTKEVAEQRAGNLQREMAEEVAEQSEEIRAIKKELIQSIEKKYRTIKTDTMAVLGSQFESGWDETRDELLGAIEEARGKLQQEERARDEIVTFMVTNFGQEILKAQQMVQRERQERIDSHKRLLTSICNLQEEMTSQILSEKRESASAIQGLEGYLEQLCFKIESHVLR